MNEPVKVEKHMEMQVRWTGRMLVLLCLDTFAWVGAAVIYWLAPRELRQNGNFLASLIGTAVVVSGACVVLVLREIRILKRASMSSQGSTFPLNFPPIIR